MSPVSAQMPSAPSALAVTMQGFPAPSTQTQEPAVIQAPKNWRFNNCLQQKL